MSVRGAVAETPRADVSAFQRDGFLAPVRLLEGAQCRLLRDYRRHTTHRRPDGLWEKGRALNERLIYDLAMRPRLLACLRPLLGEDIVLWGAKLVERNPGEVHPWHVDIECAAPGVECVTVWIGFEHTSGSTLSLLAGSHRFGKPIQQVQAEKQFRRGEASDDVVLGWGRELDPEARLVYPDVEDGDAILMDGRLWHGSVSRRAAGMRRALLLQYASASSRMLVPNYDKLEWPFEFKDEAAPAVVVSGAGRTAGALQPPPRVSDSALKPVVVEMHPIAVPLPAHGRDFKPHHFFEGPSPVHDVIESHASVLQPGAMPHRPHTHIEEELLIILDGQADLLLGESDDPDAATRHPVTRGDFAYYPAFQFHTLQNTGAAPLSYVMFKWRNTPFEVTAPLETRVCRYPGRPVLAPGSSFRSSLVFEVPTSFLGTLHAHFSVVAPGGGYAVHTDDHDLAIVMFEGEVETLGRTLTAHDVLYCAAGIPHGLQNRSTAPAHYLVFEFHAPEDGRVLRSTHDLRPLPRRTDPWLQRARRLLAHAIRTFVPGQVRPSP